MIFTPFFLCIDAGTSRFKGALITAQGRLLAKSEYLYRNRNSLVHHYSPGELENALVHTLQRFQGKIAGKNLAGIGVTGHGPTLIPVDREGASLYTGVGYLDERVKKYIKQLDKSTSDRITSSMYTPIALFFKTELPGIYQKTYRFLQSFDYISFILTGNFYATSSSSSIKPWDHTQLDNAGLDTDKFPPIYYMGGLLGKTTVNAEKAYGVRPGVPVYAVGVDFAAALAGTNITSRGKSCERAGSSGGINLCWDRHIADRRLLSYQHFIPGLWNTAGITSTSGKAMEWAANLLDIESFKDQVIRFKNRPPEVIFFPYLQGERTPLWNPGAKGAFFGVSKNHTRTDLFYSVIIGVVMSLRDCMEIIEQNHCSFIHPVITTGGQARNTSLVQLKADITGKTFAKVQVDDAELLGIAAVIAAAAGFYKDLSSAAENMVKITRVFNPRGKFFQHYSEIFYRYKELQSMLSEYYSNLADP
ncbi:MAG: xylulokinase [Spirochaetota bacterium]